MADRPLSDHLYDSSGQITSTGSANAYVIAITEQLNGYYQGMPPIRFKANFSCTGAATANIVTQNAPAGLGAKALKKNGGANDVASGDIASGGIYTLAYDGTNFQVLELNTAAGGTAAPADAQYIVATADGTLSAERVATDTTTVDVDAGTANQMKWHVLEVPGIDAAGLVARTGAANYEARTLTAPAAGIGVSNGDGVSGNPTLSLANDLAAIEGLGSTGIAVRSAADTWVQRSIAVGTGLAISNGNGVSGNPTASLSFLGLEALTDPGGDRIAFWDDSAGAFAWLLAGTGLSITDTTIDVTISGSGMPRGHIFGLRISNNGTDANNDIDIATGEARSDDNTADITLASGLTKRLDAAWAVGTGNGGLDTGAEAANTWYYVWLIKRSDTGVVDALFSASATAPTMPANYDKKRRIGAVRNNASSNILPFTQNANDPELFLFNTTILDIATGSLTTSRLLMTLTIPPSMTALFRATMEAAAGEGETIVVLQPTSETDAAPSRTAVPGFSLINIDEAGSTVGAAGHFEMTVDASSQIAARSSAAATDLNIMTQGWRDGRGRLN